MREIQLTREELLKAKGVHHSDRIIPFDEITLVNDIVDYLAHGGLVGDKLPWRSTHSDVAIGEGELSLWCGINGHGKSALINMIACHFVMQRKNVIMCSMEMPPKVLIGNMVKQAAGCYPSEDFARKWLASSGEHGAVCDIEGKISPDVILGLCHYAGSNLRVNHIFIDSLSMCGIAQGEHDEIGLFVSELRSIAKRYAFHIHLVVHMRKGEDENKILTKFDIVGTGQITDLADKVFIVQRNKRREHEMKFYERGESCNMEVINEPGTYVRLVKNRQDGEEAVYGLYFEKASQQFVPTEGKVMELGNA